ncbi:MAG: ATP-binding protein [Lachnospiraceae bacterium]|nr:ATP-binding protein [Lachnospiraceae bacterium]
MNIIGRVKEKDRLEQSVLSGRPEFLVVYGRRRVGKTFLVKEYFNNRFSFYSMGVLDGKTRSQLKAFNEALTAYGDEDKKIPKDWFEAFRRLKCLLQKKDVARDFASGRRVVFLDEAPWMDTPRSDFRMALEYFWNSWASTETDILLIVCGSATSWIINNILFDKGGFYNRITGQILLNPFSLKECEEYFKNNGIVMTRGQIIDSYMVFGGIPYYLNLFDRRQSLAQNIDNLVINPLGQLHYECDHLFSSLFRNPGNHMKIISTIADEKRGMSRTDLAGKSGISDGEGLTKALRELEQCGFIRKYRNYTTSKQGFIYQLIDPFVLFSQYFLKEEAIDSWQKYYKTPAYYAWRGNAFEMLCLWHVPQIKAALGITGISSTEYSWRSKKKKDGAQIDLLIDRRDDIVNLCEMKYTDDEFAIDSKYAGNLANKAEVFRMEAAPKKAVHVTLITVKGLKRNEYAYAVQNVITGDDLFAV